MGGVCSSSSSDVRPVPIIPAATPPSSNPRTPGNGSGSGSLIIANGNGNGNGSGSIRTTRPTPFVKDASLFALLLKTNTESNTSSTALSMPPLLPSATVTNTPNHSLGGMSRTDSARQLNSSGGGNSGAAARRQQDKQQHHPINPLALPPQQHLQQSSSTQVNNVSHSYYYSLMAAPTLSSDIPASSSSTSHVSILADLLVSPFGTVFPMPVLVTFASYFQVVHYSSGELIFASGEEADCLYLIRHGMVAIRAERKISNSPVHNNNNNNTLNNARQTMHRKDSSTSGLGLSAQSRFPSISPNHARTTSQQPATVTGTSLTTTTMAATTTNDNQNKKEPSRSSSPLALPAVREASSSNNGSPQTTTTTSSVSALPQHLKFRRQSSEGLIIATHSTAATAHSSASPPSSSNSTEPSPSLSLPTTPFVPTPPLAMYRGSASHSMNRRRSLEGSFIMSGGRNDVNMLNQQSNGTGSGGNGSGSGSGGGPKRSPNLKASNRINSVHRIALAESATILSPLIQPSSSPTLGASKDTNGVNNNSSGNIPLPELIIPPPANAAQSPLSPTVLTHSISIDTGEHNSTTMGATGGGGAAGAGGVPPNLSRASSLLQSILLCRLSRGSLFGQESIRSHQHLRTTFAVCEKNNTILLMIHAKDVERFLNSFPKEITSSKEESSNTTTNNTQAQQQPPPPQQQQQQEPPNVSPAALEQTISDANSIISPLKVQPVPQSPSELTTIADASPPKQLNSDAATVASVPALQVNVDVVAEPSTAINIVPIAVPLPLPPPVTPSVDLAPASAINPTTPALTPTVPPASAVVTADWITATATATSATTAGTASTAPATAIAVPAAAPTSPNTLMPPARTSPSPRPTTPTSTSPTPTSLSTAANIPLTSTAIRTALTSCLGHTIDSILESHLPTLSRPKLALLSSLFQFVRLEAGEVLMKEGEYGSFFGMSQTALSHITHMNQLLAQQAIAATTAAAMPTSPLSRPHTPVGVHPSLSSSSPAHYHHRNRTNVSVSIPAAAAGANGVSPASTQQQPPHQPQQQPSSIFGTTTPTPSNLTMNTTMTGGSGVHCSQNHLYFLMSGTLCCSIRGTDASSKFYKIFDAAATNTTAAGNTNSSSSSGAPMIQKKMSVLSPSNSKSQLLTGITPPSTVAPTPMANAFPVTSTTPSSSSTATTNTPPSSLPPHPLCLFPAYGTKAPTHPGFLGELSLVLDIPRTASIIALSDCVLLELTQDRFHNFLQLAPEILSTFQKRLISSYHIHLLHLLVQPKIASRFVEFLKQEYSAENYYCWHSCRSFRLQFSGHLLKGKRNKNNAGDIIEKYINQQSESQVNLKYTTSQSILQKFENNQIEADMFSQAEEEVLNLMNTDSFPRFRSSENFQQVLKEINMTHLTSAGSNTDTATAAAGNYQNQAVKSGTSTPVNPNIMNEQFASTYHPDYHHPLPHPPPSSALPAPAEGRGSFNRRTSAEKAANSLQKAALTLGTTPDTISGLIISTPTAASASASVSSSGTTALITRRLGVDLHSSIPSPVLESVESGSGGSPSTQAPWPEKINIGANASPLAIQIDTITPVPVTPVYPTSTPVAVEAGTTVLAVMQEGANRGSAPAVTPIATVAAPPSEITDPDLSLSAAPVSPVVADPASSSVSPSSPTSASSNNTFAPPAVISSVPPSNMPTPPPAAAAAAASEQPVVRQPSGRLSIKINRSGNKMNGGSSTSSTASLSQIESASIAATTVGPNTGTSASDTTASGSFISTSAPSSVPASNTASTAALVTVSALQNTTIIASLENSHITDSY